MAAKVERREWEIARSAQAVAGVLGLVLIWWAVSALPWFVGKLPSPVLVARAWAGLLQEGVLWQGLWTTSWTFLAAWALAGSLGLAVGGLMALSKAARETLMPVIEVLRPIPSTAIIPLAIVLIGLTEKMNISVATYAATWPVLLTATGALCRIDDQMVHVCRQFGLQGRMRYLLWVQLPSASPELLTALRTSSVIALALTITTELVSSGNGLGSWIVRYEQAIRVPEMYACILTVMILGSVAYGLAMAAERSLTQWVARPL